MRIIAGRARGRRLLSPRGMATRPMTERAREALFSSLGRRVEGARVLDLFAGSGSLGLEALSRGATSARFVERDREALRALRANVDTVALGGVVVAGDVIGQLEAQRGEFDLVFVDPPYTLSLASVAALLELLMGRLAPGATVILHRQSGEEPPALPEGLMAADRRKYGSAVLWRFEKETP